MKTMLRSLMACTLLELPAARAAEPPGKPGDPAHAQTPAEPSSWQDHLTLGTRLTCFILQDSTSASFLGTIHELDENQDYLPWKLYASWQFNPKWGLELTWDQIAADAKTSVADHHTDGTFGLAGPILDGVYRLDRHGRFTPYVQCGLAWLLGDFDPEPWWGLGYPSEGVWLEYGATGEPRNGVTREITLDDAPGLVAAAGSRVALSRRWSGDILLRYMYIESDATLTMYRQGRPIPGTRASNTIPFSNLALGVGLDYAF